MLLLFVHKLGKRNPTMWLFYLILCGHIIITVRALAHLIHGAEDVSIVLLEAADAGQASQSSRQLVPVQDAKVGHAQRQLSPGARSVIKHQAAVKRTA